VKKGEKGEKGEKGKRLKGRKWKSVSLNLQFDKTILNFFPFPLLTF